MFVSCNVCIDRGAASGSGEAAYHPITLLRMNMAAMGSVEAMEDDTSASPLALGSW